MLNQNFKTKNMKKQIKKLLERLEEVSEYVYYVKFFSDESYLLYDFSDRCIAECHTEAELIEAIKTEIKKF